MFTRLTFADVLAQERRLWEGNDCHEPAGSPAGGQFCSKGGGARGAPLARTGEFIAPPKPHTLRPETQAAAYDAQVRLGHIRSYDKGGVTPKAKKPPLFSGMADRTARLTTQITSAVTVYDARQARRGRQHNPYAISHYLRAADEAMADIEQGTPVRQAILDNFLGPLADHVLKAVGEPKRTKDEAYAQR